MKALENGAICKCFSKWSDLRKAISLKTHCFQRKPKPWSFENDDFSPYCTRILLRSKRIIGKTSVIIQSLAVKSGVTKTIQGHMKTEDNIDITKRNRIPLYDTYSQLSLKSFMPISNSEHFASLCLRNSFISVQ